MEYFANGGRATKKARSEETKGGRPRTQELWFSREDSRGHLGREGGIAGGLFKILTKRGVDFNPSEGEGPNITDTRVQ